MAIYRIFPEKDTFIYTEQVLANAGKDQVVEIGGYPNSAGIGQTSRILTKFSDTEINNVIDNEIGSTNFSSSIKLYLAEASELPVEFTLYAYPISSSTEWDNGIGEFGDTPVNKTGVSWTYIQAGESNAWKTSDWPAGVTASFISSKTGGGTWYIENNSESTEFSQSFNLNTDLDADINVTAAIKQIYNNQLTNRGFILKLQDDYEFYTTSSIRLKYFSKDTNTIYPPFLEFGWDDRTYDQGTLSLLSTDICNIDIKNNKGVYADTGKQRFKISARPQYPTRAFTTSSVYLTNNVLPSASYWGLRDENTEEMIVDFNTDFTKISCDSNGSFFDVYMGGLQPERYYRILIKTEIDNSTIVVDNQNVFKVVRNG
jgi:hypothetical protein